MKTEKLSLKNIKNVLSRTEMKKIMAGSGGNGCGQGCYNYCQCGSCVPDGLGSHGTCQM